MTSSERPLVQAARGRASLLATSVAPAREAKAAFEDVVRPHYDALVRRLFMVLRDREAAQDIAQDAYLQAFRAWPRFEGGDVRAWLYTIGLRLAFNERRRRLRWLSAVRRFEPKPWAAPVDPDLWAALGRLDPRTRGALLLNVVDGYTQREIAGMLAIPEGTVASWISRGRAALRADLGAEERDR